MANIYVALKDLSQFVPFKIDSIVSIPTTPVSVKLFRNRYLHENQGREIKIMMTFHKQSFLVKNKEPPSSTQMHLMFLLNSVDHLPQNVKSRRFLCTNKNLKIKIFFNGEHEEYFAENTILKKMYIPQVLYSTVFIKSFILCISRQDINVPLKYFLKQCTTYLVVWNLSDIGINQLNLPGKFSLIFSSI